MNVSFSLPRALDFPALQRLLGPLFAAESVLIESAPPRLRCRCTPAQGAELERALGEAFAVGIPASSDDVGDEATPALHRVADAVLTLVLPAPDALPAEFVATLVEWGAMPRALRRLSMSSGGDLALELYFDGWSRCESRIPTIQSLADRWGVDLALAPSDSKRPRRRLVAFDMDSTLIQCEVIDELAARAGVGEEVAAITARAMRGELDFRSSFRERMGKLRGLSAQELDNVALQLPLMPGAETLLRRLRAHGHYTVILSGGFDYFAHRVQQRLGFDEVHANHLHIVDGRLTGDVEGEIVDGARKALLLQQVAAAQGIAMQDTVAVGDGANDLPMLAVAGMGVAFHAKPLVRQEARFAMMHADLSGLLGLLGIPGELPAGAS